MLLEAEEDELCRKMDCPNKGNPFTKGLCIRKDNGSWVIDEARHPSVMFLFRDPNKNLPGPVEYVLNLKPRNGRVGLGRYLGTRYGDVFQRLHDGDVVYLDNFVRRAFMKDTEGSKSERTIVPLNELNRDYTNLARHAMTCCFDVTQRLLRKEPPDRLVITNLENLWSVFEAGLLTQIPERAMTCLESRGGHFCLCLGERFTIRGCDFPVYFYPHPGSLSPRYEDHLAGHPRCREAVKRAIGLVTGD